MYLIDDKGTNIGEVDINVALDTAKNKNLDLVQVSIKDNLPICKILDYSKFLYDQKSRFKKVKKVKQKEIKLKPNTAEGDLNNKINLGKKFLNSGNMVKYIVEFRGREKAFPELGEKKLQIVESEFIGLGKVEKRSKFKGGKIYLILSPKSSK